MEISCPLTMAAGPCGTGDGMTLEAAAGAVAVGTTGFGAPTGAGEEPQADTMSGSDITTSKAATLAINDNFFDKRGLPFLIQLVGVWCESRCIITQRRSFVQTNNRVKLDNPPEHGYNRAEVEPGLSH
jgi:hypothetical protein